MIAIIEEDIFRADSVSVVDLVALLQLGYEKRHVILTEPAFEPDVASAVNGWLEQYTRDSLREELEWTLEWGPLRHEELSGEVREIRVAAIEHSDWEATPPRLQPSDALALLRTPLKLMVEDRLSDWAFLQCMLPDEQRAEILRAYEARWIEIVHGGGINSMCRAVRATLEGETARLDAWRHWLLFDSDAREPDDPSSRARLLRTRCEDADVAYHMLRRRTAENYIERPALSFWEQHGQQRARQRIVAAFLQLDRDQRHHFNMKEGLNGDRASGPGLHAQFHELTRFQKEHLATGFGARIGRTFSATDRHGTPCFDDTWFEDEGAFEERVEIAGQILEML